MRKQKNQILKKIEKVKAPITPRNGRVIAAATNENCKALLAFNRRKNARRNAALNMILTDEREFPPKAEANQVALDPLYRFLNWQTTLTERRLFFVDWGSARPPTN